MNLYPFQKSAQIKINSLLNAGRQPVLCMPTGTGKTKTAVQITSDRVNLKERIFVLTPQVEIFNQWQIEFHNSGIDAGYINDKGVMGRGKNVYVCMPMSLNNILSVLPEKFKPDLIISDECQHSLATSWTNIYKFFPDALRLGLTATPKRTDGIPLKNIYTDIVEPITAREAIDQGFLTEPLLIVPEQYMQDVPVQNGEYDLDEQARALGKTQIIGDVISQYSDIFAGLPVLVACSTFEHAKIMTDEFNSIGWNFAHIHSGLSAFDRSAMLKGIRNKTLNGLCTVGIGIEGLDIPGLYGLIWLRRTKSVTIYLQFIGRILRKHEGKKYGIILDPVGNVFIHGRPDMPRRWTLDGTNEKNDADDFAPKMKICPCCSAMNAEINIKCHICGYDFTQENEPGRGRSFPVMVDGNMVILDYEKMSSRKEEIKIELENQRQSQKEKNNTIDEPKKILQSDKMKILKNGLEKRSGIFADMVREYL